jgi:hypothetical protein
MDWIKSWNERYDRAPEDTRFGVVVAALLLVGMINMLLTIHSGFPFGLLLLAAIVFVAWVRISYVMEVPPEARGGVAGESNKLDIGWLYGLNRWYDNLPEDRQFWVVPVVLLVAGFVNMMLTLAHAFPFGLLFLLALLALAAIRVPFIRGWLREPPSLSLAATAAVTHTSPAPAAVTHTEPLPMLSKTPRSEPVPMPAIPHPPDPPEVE